MGFIGNLVGQIRGRDNDDNDDYYLDDDYDEQMDSDDYDDDYEDDEEDQPRSSIFAGLKSRASRSDDDRQEAKSEGIFTRRSNSKVVKMQQAPASMEVTMRRPKVLDDARVICEELLDGKAVIINLEGLDSSTAQRITDFTYGVLTSIRGGMEKVSSYILIASPQNIALTGDFKGDFSRDYMGEEQPQRRAAGGYNF